MGIFNKIVQKGPGWFVQRSWYGLKTSRNSGIRSLARLLTGRSKALQSDLYGFYDLNSSSPSYNFLQFLLCLEHFAADTNQPSYSVVIVPKGIPAKLEWNVLKESYGTDAINYRTMHLLSDLATLGPRCRGVFALADRSIAKLFAQHGSTFPKDYGFYIGGGFDADLHTSLITNGVRAELMPPVHASKLVDDWMAWQKPSRGLVTITLRNSTFDPVRNSDLPEWTKFAEYLRKAGYQPVIIPDTDTAFSEQTATVADASIGTAAAFNVGVRLSLYQRAFVNFFVPNGPSGLAVYSGKIKYIGMKTWLPDSAITPNNPEAYGYMNANNTAAVWASPGQWLTGELDKYPNLVRLFEQFVSTIS